MKLREKIGSLVLKKGSRQLPENPNDIRIRNTFVNDMDQISQMKILIYNIWYEGDSDNLLNIHRVNNAIQYNYDYMFNENKFSYFWCQSSTETDFKRTHSGMAREIVDVLTNIIGSSKTTMDKGDLLKYEKGKTPIESIREANDFDNMEKQIIIPMVLVEGWGAIKIDWDLDVCTEPIFQYYRAKDVDFIYKYKTRLVGFVFKDYYVKNGNTYLLMETRCRDGKDLVCEKEFFEIDRNDNLTPMEASDVKKIFPEINLDGFRVTDFPYLLSQEFIFFKDSSNVGYGRSIYSGKLDLFDDLDQALSLASMAVRRSTPRVFIDSEFLERDENGMPIAPKEFDCKYVTYRGGKDGNGSANSTEPAKVIQPNLNLEQYQMQASDIALHILQGIMSPATMGIDVSKKDNAVAQREKEKITIFTREAIMKNYGNELCSLFTQALCIREYIQKGLANETEPCITVTDYNVHCEFETFADASFENKLTTLGNAYTTDCISPELFVEKLWGDSLDDETKKRELDYLKKMKEKSAGMGGMPMDFDDNARVDEPDYSESKENSESDMTNSSYNRNNEKG